MGIDVKIGQEVSVDVNKAIQLYESGKSTSEIGRLLGCSGSTISRRLKAAGVVVKKRSSLDIGRIIELNNLGYSSNQIDKILGCSHGQSSRFLRMHGISPGKGVTARHEVECVRCGKKFETDNATRTKCDSCRETYDHPTAKCERCGKEFEKKHPVQRYCSYGCRKADARKIQEPIRHICACCMNEFYDYNPNAVYCGDECRKIRRPKQVRVELCVWCGKPFITDRNGKSYCSKRCIDRAGGKRRKARIRTQYPNVDEIPLRALYERDGGVCQICGDPTDWDDCVYNENGIFIAGPKYPTHDHIVPVSKGGKHTWDNAQLAHFECNTKKSAKLPEVAYA